MNCADELIGNSSFYGPANRSNQSQAIEQGKKVRAAIVLFKTEYMDTLSGVVPYTVANPPVVSTVNTSGTVNTYGSAGYASGNYDSSGTIRVVQFEWHDYDPLQNLVSRMTASSR